MKSRRKNIPGGRDSTNGALKHSSGHGRLLALFPCVISMTAAQQSPHWAPHAQAKPFCQTSLSLLPCRAQDATRWATPVPEDEMWTLYPPLYASAVLLRPPGTALSSHLHLLKSFHSSSSGQDGKGTVHPACPTEGSYTPGQLHRAAEDRDKYTVAGDWGGRVMFGAPSPSGKLTTCGTPLRGLKAARNLLVDQGPEGLSSSLTLAGLTGKPLPSPSVSVTPLSHQQQ